MSQDQPFRIISTDEFYDYTAKWRSFLDSHPEKLDRCFRYGGFLNYMYLNAVDVMSLLSSVGTTVIRVSFAVVPVPVHEPTDHVFALVLHGEDSDGNPTSGYFLAAIPGQTGSVESTCAADKRITTAAGISGITATGTATPSFEPLPYDLAINWTNNWKQFDSANKWVVEITKELFSTVYSSEEGNYLQGYAYPLKDFLLALSPLQAESRKRLTFVFGVHEYYKPDVLPADAFSQLFDMVITVEEPDNYIRMETRQPYFDISMPSPPYHSSNRAHKR
ncbi:MAG TPA: hypothetical protein VF598_07870 [Hymenobacter sp.]|jgi:hypothetical protein